MNNDAEVIEELLVALEGAANYCRGMALDPSLQKNHKEALQAKAAELDAISEQHKKISAMLKGT